MVRKFTESNIVSISEDLFFRKVTLDDQQILFDLMKRIYPIAYEHFWNDDGSWYVNGLYNKENLKKELSEENTLYFLVYFQNQLIGIIRIVYDLDQEYNPNSSYIKLHRLYLDPLFHNKGLGSKIMTWLIDHSKRLGYSYLWLEAMEKKPQALYFYKNLGFNSINKVRLEFELLKDDYRGMFTMTKYLN